MGGIRCCVSAARFRHNHEGGGTSNTKVLPKARRYGNTNLFAGRFLVTDSIIGIAWLVFLSRTMKAEALALKWEGNE